MFLLKILILLIVFIIPAFFLIKSGLIFGKYGLAGIRPNKAVISILLLIAAMNADRERGAYHGF
jgi:hypothetical protein